LRFAIMWGTPRDAGRLSTPRRAFTHVRTVKNPDGRIDVSDDIPQTRRRRADAAPAEAEAVPAGGKGADTGAVDGARIDDADAADVQNISSQNDIPGVGTRAADGSMESGDGPDTIPPHGRRTSPPRDTDPDADAPASLAEQFEPAVDPGYAATSRVAGPAASAGDPGDADAAESSPATRAADRVGGRVGGRLGIIPAGVVGAVSIVLFAFAVPFTPALAWIGIALQVAIFAALAVGASTQRPGRYRSLNVTVFTFAQIAAAVIFGILVVTTALAQ
jgi:hypothetical protein